MEFIEQLQAMKIGQNTGYDYFLTIVIFVGLAVILKIFQAIILARLHKLALKTKTELDDILIEMISPKVKEIEERFSRGEGLNNEDINTLLLKSQYNHISHLDQRLDEVTASVQGLEEKFSGLEGKFAGLEGKFSGLEGKFAGLEGKFELIKTDLEGKFCSSEIGH